MKFLLYILFKIFCLRRIFGEDVESTVAAATLIFDVYILGVHLCFRRFPIDGFSGK